MDKEAMIYALQMALRFMTDRPELARMYINSTIEHIRSNGVPNTDFNLTRNSSSSQVNSMLDGLPTV
jgi:hypothetical protein